MTDVKEMYLDLLKRTLTRFDLGDDYYPPDFSSQRAQDLLKLISRPLAKKNLRLMSVRPFDARAREQGLDHPADAETMVGLRRLENLQELIFTVLKEKIPGDLLEAGVWRGGASIFMRGVLKAHGVQDRVVWAADSFQGLPPPRAEHAADRDDRHSLNRFLAVSLSEVQRNFRRYGLLDDQVRFLAGWFAETLPTAPIDQLALLRLDGDMYGSTWDILSALYAKVSPGGFVVVDDYGAIPACRSAVDDYREENGIQDDLIEIDWTGVYWRRAVL